MLEVVSPAYNTDAPLKEYSKVLWIIFILTVVKLGIVHDKYWFWPSHAMVEELLDEVFIQNTASRFLEILAKERTPPEYM